MNLANFGYIKNCQNEVLGIKNDNIYSGSKVGAYYKGTLPKKGQLWRLETYADGYFFVVSAANEELVLDVEGERNASGTRIIVYQRKFPPADNQLFRWNEGMIQSRLNSDLVLVLDRNSCESTAVVRSKHVRNDNQWSFEYQTMDWRYIRTYDTGKVLDSEGNSRSPPGTKIIAYQKKPDPSSNQLWRLESVGNGWFFIVSAMNPNYVLDVEGGNNSPGARVILWEKKYASNAENQLFRWNQNMLESRMNSNLVLDINGSDGTSIILWSKHGGSNQRWYLDSPQ